MLETLPFRAPIDHQINYAAGRRLDGTVVVGNPHSLKIYHCEPPITEQKQPDGAAEESYMQGVIGGTEAAWDESAIA